jgi:hypothetical protein
MRAITTITADLADDDTRPARTRRREGRQTARRTAILDSAGYQRRWTAGRARIAA